MKNYTELAAEHIRIHGATAVQQLPDESKAVAPMLDTISAEGSESLERLRSAMAKMTEEQRAALTWTDKVALIQGREIEVATKSTVSAGLTWTERCRRQLEAEKKEKEKGRKK